VFSGIFLELVVLELDSWRFSSFWGLMGRDRVEPFALRGRATGAKGGGGIMYASCDREALMRKLV
jgi:hypothetical protein